MKELTGTLVIGGNETTSGTFIRKEEVESEVETKNNIIMLHKIIDCKHKDEIDELVNALEDATLHGRWDNHQDMVDSYNKSIALIKKHRGNK